LRRRHGKGAIVNVSTMVGRYGAAGLEASSRIKQAESILRPKAWAADMPKASRNAVSPGPDPYEGTVTMGEDRSCGRLARSTRRAPPAPEEIAEANRVHSERQRQLRTRCDCAGRWRQNGRIDFERDTIRRASARANLQLRGTRTMSSEPTRYSSRVRAPMGVAAIERFLSAGWEVVGSIASQARAT